MGKVMQRAVAEVSKLPEAEQEVVGAWILAELESERRWDELFARSQDVLAEMAAEEIREDEAGLTLPHDPDKLRRSESCWHGFPEPSVSKRSKRTNSSEIIRRIRVFTSNRCIQRCRSSRFGSEGSTARSAYSARRVQSFGFGSGRMSNTKLFSQGEFGERRNQQRPNYPMNRTRGRFVARR